MTWAQRLKRVFNIDIETCEQCGGAVNVIASIEDPLMIQKILSHLNTKMTMSSSYCPHKVEHRIR
jgi:16S rRNA U1498 N3-methylase RsmE